MTGDILAIVEKIRSTGFSFAPAKLFRAFLSPSALAQWPSFAASWDDLGLDTYRADGGRYRRRCFAAFAVLAGFGIDELLVFMLIRLNETRSELDAAG